MKAGIMQPYFFPYLGYVQLMGFVDQWVIFDDVQFIDKGWVNRNRILHPDEKKEWQFITLPLKNRGQFDKICALKIDNAAKWRDQILGKLTSYKKKAPRYRQTIDFVNRCFSIETDSLSRFLAHTLRVTATELNLNCEITVQSEANFALGNVEHAGQWALEISKVVGATEYINPYGGAELFDESEYRDAGISLKFLKPRLANYKQRREGFVPGLSIVDVMMWNTPEEIKRMLDEDYVLLSKAECNDLEAQ